MLTAVLSFMYNLGMRCDIRGANQEIKMSKAWTTKARMDAVMAKAGCCMTEALKYLEAEEGSVDEAVTSYLGDHGLARIAIRYEGSKDVVRHTIPRNLRDLFEVGSTWTSADGSSRYVVVSN